MSLDRADMRTCLREELGCPSTTDLSDVMLDKSIDAALAKYSKFHPRIEDITVTVTTSGIVPADEDIVAIIADSWGSRITEGIDIDNLLGFESTRDFVATFSGFGTNDIRELGMDAYLNEYEIERAADNLPAEVRLNGNQYEFMPTPTEQTVVSLRVGRLHTDATFPNRHRDELFQGAFARSLRSLALRRFKFDSVNIGGENLSLRSPGPLLELSNRLWSEFIRSLGVQRHAFVGSL